MLIQALIILGGVKKWLIFLCEGVTLAIRYQIYIRCGAVGRGVSAALKGTEGIRTRSKEGEHEFSTWLLKG